MTINLQICAAHVQLGQFRIVFLQTLTFFFVKLGTLDEQVIDAVREFQILGPW